MSAGPMDWTRLLSTRRRCDRTAAQEREGNKGRPGDDERSPFQVDLDRIVFSTPLRRLQDKTQVHPLSERKQVRTRLTHSLEVASVGRSLGYRAGLGIADVLAGLGLSPHDVGYIVQAAGLAHDIGNPPFGHAGESAIGQWFAARPQAAGLDLCRFDGNAQGLRILTRLSNWTGEGGMRLTFATVGAFAKYPGSAAAAAAGRINKAGIFDAELDFFREVATDLGLLPLPDRTDAWCRHPLVYLTEAADDICYSVADLEDGVAMDLVSLGEVEETLAPVASDPGRGGGPWFRDKNFYRAFDEEGKLSFLRGLAIRNLVGAVAETFVRHQDALLDGAFAGDLLGHSPYAEAVEACKAFAFERIYRSRAKLEVEVASFDVLGGILDALGRAVSDFERNGHAMKGLPPRSDRLLGLFPRLAEPRDRYAALLAVTDVVSSLTDREAVRLYRTLKGLAL